MNSGSVEFLILWQPSSISAHQVDRVLELQRLADFFNSDVPRVIGIPNMANDHVVLSGHSRARDTSLAQDRQCCESKTAPPLGAGLPRSCTRAGPVKPGSIGPPARSREDLAVERELLLFHP